MKMFPKKLNSFIGQQWGEKATVKLANGPTYNEIHLVTNITDSSRIERVVVNLSGTEIYSLTGAELKMLELYKKHPIEQDVYIIPFADISNNTLNGIRHTGLVTERNDNINLEIYLKDNGGADWGEPSIKGVAYVSAAQPARILLPMIKTQTMQAGTEGDNEYTTLPSGANKTVRRMHFKHADVTDLKIERDGANVFEIDKSGNELQQKRFGRTPQAGYYHFDPIASGFGMDGLFPTAHASELKFTVKTSSVAGTIPILVESITQVRQLPQAKA